MGYSMRSNLDNCLNNWIIVAKKRQKIRHRRDLVQVVGAIFFGALLLSCSVSGLARNPASGPAGIIRTTDLPPEAQETLALIKRGGPFPYSRDGAIFANREGRLPFSARGTYREYTVKTPRSRDRGARRIIAGKDKFWYTENHYRTFRLIIE